MGKKAKLQFVTAFAIACAMVALLRADVTAIYSIAPTTVQNGVASNEARAEVQGRVVKVVDGDTIAILSSATETTSVPPVAHHKIRLHGIDAPAKSQAFGQKSRQHLSSLIFGKDVRVKYKSRDKYGRILGMVYARNRASCRSAYRLVRKGREFCQMALTVSHRPCHKGLTLGSLMLSCETVLGHGALER